MNRVMLVYTLLLLLPFILFGGWRWLVKGVRGRHELMSDAPVFLLLLLGISFVGAGLYFIASKETVGIEGRYHPPTLKDGKVQPGYFDKTAE